MFLFWKVLLAHLVADFVFQFEGLYQLKVRSLWGHILHVLIHGVVLLLFLYPYLGNPEIWVFAAAVMIFHLIQDFIKYTLTKKIPKNTFLYFMTDQFVHVLVLGSILILPISSEVRGFPNDALLDAVYRDNTFTLFLIFFILLTVAGSYTIHAFYRSFVKNSRPLYGITSYEITYTLLERSIIGIIVLVTPHLLLGILLTPLVGLARLPFKKMRDRTGFLISFSYAVLLSLCFRIVL